MAKTTRKSTGPKIDMYQDVTDRILAQLEAGTAPWRKPWNTNVGRPQNLEGRAYRGINVLLTGLAGYASPFWMTYRQMQERGGHLKQLPGFTGKETGQKGTRVVLWQMLRIADKETGKPKTIPMLKHFTVFNLEQTEGVKLPKRVAEWNTPEAIEHQTIESAEDVIATYLAGGPEFREYGDRAYYSPEADSITVPPITAYANVDEYYATVFHEIGHSTGHEARLDRFTGKGRAFGCADYGREELVAEMTSAFLQAETGVETAEQNSAAYLASWIRSIKEDPKAVVVAAGAAQKAADLVLGRSATAEVVETSGGDVEVVESPERVAA